LDDRAIAVAFIICCIGYCRHDFNIGVLKAFVNLSDFAGMILVQALRSAFSAPQCHI